jgi:hypothetical protein
MCGAVVPSAQAQDIRGTTAGNCVLAPVAVPLFRGTPAAVIAATPAAARQSNSGNLDQAAIEKAISEIVKCINTGDPSFQYAVFTPRYLATQFVEQAAHYQPEFEAQLDTPAQPASVPFDLVTIENLQEQQDGRVQVTLVLTANQDTYRDTLLLAFIDGHWLIDEVVALDPTH